YSGFAPRSYGIDTRTMGILDVGSPQGAGEKKSLGRHFSAVRNTGPLRVLHGGQPLEPMRKSDLLDVVVDSSGERVLLRSRERIVCYDIYYGYYAEWTTGNYFRFQDRRELHRVEAAPAEGWLSLTAAPITGGRD